MSPKVLCDENISNSIITSLKKWGFTVLRVTPGMKDRQVAEMAQREKCLLLTFDSDFANILLYPPGMFFGIIRINMEPPTPELVEVALKSIFIYFKTAEDFRGKLIIADGDRFRVWGEK